MPVYVEISPNPVNASSATVAVADGDADSGMSEKESIVITSTDGTTKTYVVIDDNETAVATGTTLAADSDTGSGTAGSALTGGIAVAINLSGTLSSQNAFLVQLKAAIENANGHNGKIIVSVVPTEANGTQLITLTQRDAGSAGNVAITDDISQVTTVGFSGGTDNGYRSGIVTLPNRVRIREMDSRLGLYPKIKRTGDKDRRGNDNVTPFDDRETVLFNKGVSNLLFGSLVTTGSSQSLLPYAGNNNPNEGISGTGNVIAGISDSFYMTDYKELASRQNDNENLSPFDESRLFLKDTNFYLTGTLDTDYPGFSSRLHDKTQIVIDISSATQTSVGLINKTDHASLANRDTTDVKNQLMAYYNFQNKRWEKIARGVNGNVSSASLDSLRNMVETAAVGFSHVGQFATGSSYNVNETLVDDIALSHYSRPIKTFGFPFHAKYVATGSQVLKMSDYISSPFLVEKIRFDFDSMKFEIGDDTHGGIRSHAIFGRQGASSSPRFFNGFGVSNHTFFLLRQIRKKENIVVNVNSGRRSIDPVLTSSTFTANIPGDAFLSPRVTAGTEIGTSVTHVTSSRELITYSQLTTFVSASDNAQALKNVTLNTILNSGVFRDATLRITPEGATSSLITGAEFTGSVSIESPVRISPKTPLVSALVISCSDANDNTMQQGLYLSDEFGGRAGGSLDASSRALYNGQASLKKGSPFTLGSSDGVQGSNAIETFESSNIDTLDENSPYILFPEDEIVIGYQFPLSRDLTLGTAPESDATKFTKTVFEGPAKLVLFGSQIKNNQEFHDTLNQPLTSEAVHESLHYDNPVVDQFEISSRDELSGSYLDVYRNTELGITSDNNIQIQSLSTSGNNLAGSLQRFNRLTDKTHIYYDSAVPDPLALWSLQTGKNVYVTSKGDKALSFGVFGSAHDAELEANHILTSGSNSAWFKSFAYDNSLGRISFDSQKSNLKNTFLYFMDGKLSSAAFANDKDQYIANFLGFNFNNHDDNISLPAVIGSGSFNKSIENALMWLYGFGSGISGSLKGSNTSANEHYEVTERPRGFKYGVLSVVPLGRTVVYRGGNFGQYADMIEQGQDTIYLLPDKTLTEGPVDIKFVARESDTTFKILNGSTVIANTIQSSNISTAATSSLPYFDDLVARNRGITSDTSAAQTTSATQTITVVAED